MVLVSFEIQVVNVDQSCISCNSAGQELFHLSTLFDACEVKSSTVTEQTMIFVHAQQLQVIDKITTLLQDSKFVLEKLLTKKAIDTKAQFSVKICQIPQEVFVHLLGKWKNVAEEKFEKRPIWHKLRPFQKETVCRALNKYCKSRMMICDEMGLGKSIQALACIEHVENGWPAVVVCPTTNKQNWVSEITEHLGIKQSEILIGKSTKALEKILLDDTQQVKIIIVSYQLIDKLVDLLDRKKCRFWPRSIIVDESHNIKNWKAKKTQVLLKFIPRIEYRFLLSGTPMTRAKEYFGQLNALHSDLFPYFTKFADRYCMPSFSFLKIGNMRKRIVNYDRSTNLIELHAILQRTFMMRRTKQQVLPDLPPKIRNKFILNPTSRIKKTDTDSKSFLQQLHQGVAAKAENIVENFLDDRVLPEKEVWFYHHMEMKKAIAAWLLKSNISHIISDGQGTFYHTGEKGKLYEPVDRNQVIDIFQKCKRPCRIAFLSLLCWNSGVTLVVASSVLFFELHSEIIVNLQAEDRVHRIGQKSDKITITFLIQSGSIDEEIWALLSSKNENLTSVLDGEAKKFDNI